MHTNWIKVGGKSCERLELEVESKVESRLQSKSYRQDEISYIKSVDYCPINSTLIASEQELNTLRRLCQAWNVEIKPFEISSHRPIIGPVIVAIKKLIFPILRVFLKDFVTQQRDFNAASISLMGTLLSERAKSQPRKSY